MSSSANANGGATQSNRGTSGNRNRHETKKKKDLFTGNVDGFGDDALTMQGERPRGMGANYTRFKTSLLAYIGRQVSKGVARTWAKVYIMSDDPKWKPLRPTKPEEPSDESDKDAMAEYEEATDLYNSRSRDYQEHIGGKWDAAKLELWCTILGQCSPKLHDALQQSVDYNKAETTNDSIWLLRQSNVLSGGGRITGFPAWQRAKALKNLLLYTQGRNTPLDEYINEFRAKVKTFETLGGSLTNMMDEWTRADGSTVKTKQALIVCLFLTNANQQRYGDCIRSLQNDAATNYVRYPASLEHAYTMLDEFVAAPKGNNNNNNNNNESVES